MNLRAAHLADLRGSGLSDAQIDACGFWSETSVERVRELLGWSTAPAAPWPVLAIPYRTADGHPGGYVRVKPDSPRVVNGSVVKYESPLGRRPQVFFPPCFRRFLASGKPLLITEGEKKAAAVDQYGYSCVGLAGVYGWQVPRTREERGSAERRLWPELLEAIRPAREVVIVFDFDAGWNEHVSRARTLLAAALLSAGFAVRLTTHVLKGEGHAKAGIDDVLASGGLCALRHLLRWAEEATIPPWLSQPSSREEGV